MSSVETEDLMQRLQKNRNQTDARGRMLPDGKQTRFLTFKERQARKEEMDTIQGILDQPSWVNKGLTADIRRTLNNRRNHLEDDLKENTPPSVSPTTRDALYKYQKALEEQIKEGMPTSEVMRRNPVGAVDMHTRWEKANKERIRTWKNVCRLVEPDNDQKDYTNVERLRPAGITQDMAATYMMGAQIPGHFAMTEMAKANWPLGEPKVDTPLAQAERREMAEEVAKESGITDPNEIEELKAEIKKLQEQIASGNQPERKKHTGKSWVCTWPKCGETILTTHKGIHIAKHRREQFKQLADPLAE